MNSELVGPKKEKAAERKYPYLGIFQRHLGSLPNLRQGLVVLFVSRETGTVIHEVGTSHGLGYHCCNWTEESFEPLKGKITLSNYRLTRDSNQGGI